MHSFYFQRLAFQLLLVLLLLIFHPQEAFLTSASTRWRGQDVLKSKHRPVFPGSLQQRTQQQKKFSAIKLSKVGISSLQREDLKIRPRFSRLVEWIVRSAVTARTKSYRNLRVTCFSPSTVKLLTGYLPKIKISFDELHVQGLQITGGADLQSIGAEFKVAAFPLKIFKKIRALKRPLELHGKVQLLREDIEKSTAIRKVTQNLIDKILSQASKTLPQLGDVVSIIVQKVSTSQQGLHFTGILNSAITSAIPFTIATGLRFEGNGHVLILDKPELSLNNGSPLEIKIPILASGDIGIDIGKNAKLEEVRLGDGGVMIKARFLFSPLSQPLSGNVLEEKALYFYDVGSFLCGVLGLSQL